MEDSDKTKEQFWEELKKLRQRNEELEKAEADLRESEERFRQVYEHMAIGVARVSLDFHIQNANEAYCRMMGYTEDELIGKHLKEITHPEVLKENLRKQMRLARGEIDHYRMEKQFIHKSGRVVHGILDANLVRNAEGKPIYFLGSVLDITQRKRAQRELQKAELRYRTIANFTYDWETWQNPDGTFRYVSPSCERITGYSATQFMEDSLLLESIILPEDRKIWIEHKEEAIHIKKSHEVQFRIQNRFGEMLWIEHVCCPITDERGEFLGWHTSNRDITARKRAESALQESEEKYRTIFENAPLGLFRSTPAGKFIEVNPALAKMLGYDSPETVIREIYDIAEQVYVRSEDRKPIVEKQVNTPGLERYINHYRRANGEEFIANLYLRTVLDEDGVPIYFEGIVEDITEQKKVEEALIRSEQKLREVNATKDKFFDIIAHDLKNPLAAAKNAADYLLRYFPELTDMERESLAKNLDSSISNLFKLLENLLEWARTQTSRIEYNPKKEDLNSMIEQNISLLCEVAEHKNIDLKFSEDNCILVHADRDMVETILRNLLSNAIKFTKTGGEVEIFTEIKGDFVEISVADNGVGIRAEKLEHIFDIQEDHKSTRGTENEGGTGLGLILCKEFVERHGGQIWVESELDKGSTFRFTLRKSRGKQ